MNQNPINPASPVTQNFYFCPVDCRAEIVELLKRQSKILETLMTSMTELETKLNDINLQLTKASAEIQAEVQSLKDIIAAGGQLTPDAEAALANLTSIAQALDDMNPDAAPV